MCVCLQREHVSICGCVCSHVTDTPLDRFDRTKKLKIAAKSRREHTHTHTLSYTQLVSTQVGLLSPAAA